jgi:streptogramin lyase
LNGGVFVVHGRRYREKVALSFAGIADRIPSVRRRDFVSFAAAAATASAAGLPSRTAGKVEIVFRSPGPHPNGLQATGEGLWIIDQSEGSKAYLVAYESGKVLRSFTTETDRSSGITFDGSSLWIGSTYNRQIVRVDAHSGKTIEKHFTPGAGVIYKMVGDPPARSSPLVTLKTAPPRPKVQPIAKLVQQPSVGGFQAGAVLDAAAPGTGAHGQEWRDGFLWMAVPPSREVYKIDPKTWTVHRKFPTAANRPHGIGWEGRYLWVTDSNLNAFFKHDPDTGAMAEKIQLRDSDPLPHGMTIRNGYMWYCDDVGVVCRFRM